MDGAFSLILTYLGNGKKGLRVSPWGVPPLDDLRKWVQREWCGAFRHPERRKTSYVKETLIKSQDQCFLKKGLSENMRTESKDLSVAENGG